MCVGNCRGAERRSRMRSFHAFTCSALLISSLSFLACSSGNGGTGTAGAAGGGIAGQTGGAGGSSGQGGGMAPGGSGGVAGAAGNAGGTAGQAGDAGSRGGGGGVGTGGVAGNSGGGGGNAGGGAGGTGGGSTGGAAGGGGAGTTGQGAGGSGGNPGGAGGTAGTGGAAGTGFGGQKGPFVLAQASSPVAVTTDDRAVVWVESQTVYTCPVGGCNSGMQISRSAFADPVVGGVAMDATYAYWLADSGNSVLKCPLTGCFLPNEVFQGPPESGFAQIATNSNAVFLSAFPGLIVECSPSGCSSQETDIIRRPDSLMTPFALDATGVFLVYTGERPGEYYCAFGSCPPNLDNPLLPFNGYSGVAASSGIGYFWGGTSIVSCAATGCSGIPTTVTNSAGAISSVAADGTAVYWTTTNSSTPSAGTMQRCLLPDCPGGPTVLAPNQTNPASIVASAHYVVWVNMGTSGTDAAIMGWMKQPALP